MSTAVPRRHADGPGLYTRLVSGLVFPLHERLKHHDTVAVRRGLEESQWWPRDRIEALQLQRLRTLLADVGAHVPYYSACSASAASSPPACKAWPTCSACPS